MSNHAMSCKHNVHMNSLCIECDYPELRLYAEDLQKEIDRLKADNEDLRREAKEALVKYGKHPEDCGVHCFHVYYERYFDCNCGLDSIFEKLGGKKP